MWCPVEGLTQRVSMIYGAKVCHRFAAEFDPLDAFISAMQDTNSTQIRHCTRTVKYLKWVAVTDSMHICLTSLLALQLVRVKEHHEVHV